MGSPQGGIIIREFSMQNTYESRAVAVALKRCVDPICQWQADVYTVYFFRCDDGFYVGVTCNLGTRKARHIKRYGESVEFYALAGGLTKQRALMAEKAAIELCCEWGLNMLNVYKVATRRGRVAVRTASTIKFDVLA